jgi:hypothetical protein
MAALHSASASCARGSHALRPNRRPALAVYAGLIAASACFGVIGLISGTLDPGPTVVGRLPFHSPVFGGLALAVVVAAPCTVLAWWAARGDRRTGPAAAVSGALVTGWIVVEMIIIQELSFFHPAYLLAGAALVWLGLRTPTDRRARDRVRQARAKLARRSVRS